jgi:hypothetical protein
MGVRRGLDLTLTAPEAEPEAIHPLPLNAGAAARELAARLSYRYCGTSFEVQNYEYQSGTFYVPKCVAPNDYDDDLGEYVPIDWETVEVAVWTTEYGPAEIREWGMTTCYLDVYATTQDTLCMVGDD